MSTLPTKPNSASDSKTTNVKIVLELLKDVGKLGEAVPYLEAVAGMLKTIIEMKQEYTASKEAWVKTMESVDDIRKIIEDSLENTNKSTLPPPAHLKDATAGLERCVLGIAEAFDRIDGMNRVKRFFYRRELVADAEACAADVGRALELFQTKLQIKLAVQVDTIHTIITSGAVTPVSGQVTLPVCPSPSDFFTGRASLLEFIHTLLSHPGRRVVTIIGKGGSGKTQLALKFVDQYKPCFTCVFFLDATTSQTIETALASIAKAHNAGSSVEDARNWFAGYAEEWLLIFDNADDPFLDIGHYIPRSSHGKVIITSRNHEVSHHASLDCVVLLPDLEEADAVDLLIKLARLEDLPDHRALALEIVKELGCLALAVSHAGTYISQSSSLQNYLPLFRSHRSNLLKRKRVQSPDGYSHTIFSAFELSYVQLSNKAKLFLHVLSFFHYSNIPLQIFPRAVMKAFDHANSTSSHQYLEDFLSCYCDDQHQWQLLSFQATLEELQQASIITWNKHISTISLHSVIHACACDVVEVKSTSHIVALELLYAAAPISNNVEDVTLCIALASHADFIWNNHPIPSIFCDNTKIRNIIACIFQKAGNFTKEQLMRLDVVDIQKRVLGNQHPDTWSSMNNLAATYYSLGQLYEAKQLQEKVLSLQIKTLGEEHSDTWTSINNLANTYHDLGRLHEAKLLREKVLSLYNKCLGEQHPDTWLAMNNLALTYHDLGLLHEAEYLQESVLILQRESLGEQHPDTWSTMNNLALTYHNLGRLHETKQLQEKVLSLRRKELGEQHPDTCLAMENLALIYLDLGLLKEANQLQEKVLNLQKETLGEQHPATWRSMNNSANIHHALSDLSEAKQLRENVLSLWKNNLGEQHPDTWLAMNNLALTYYDLGDLNKAVQLQKRVLVLRQDGFGQQHPDTWLAMNNLALTYHDLGLFDKAMQLQEQVLNLRKKYFGVKHPDTWRSMRNLAKTYSSLGYHYKAEQLQQQIIQLQNQKYIE